MRKCSNISYILCKISFLLLKGLRCHILHQEFKHICVTIAPCSATPYNEALI